MTIARELADIIQSNGDVVISGGLEVNGTTTTINTTTFVVEDKNIELGGNATSNSQNDGAGISILLPDASPDEFATLTYVNSSDAWSFNKNVGIGVSPSTKLHLGGTAPLDSIIRQDSTVSGTNWEIGERAAGKWQIWEDDTDSVVATFMSIGNVGIGFDSPSNKLAVNGVITSGNFTAAGIGGSIGDANTAEVGPGYINLARDDTADAAQIRFGKNGAVHSYLETRTNGLGFITNVGDFAFEGGNVGIGTASPGTKLDIVTSTASTEGAARIQYSGANNYEILRLEAPTDNDSVLSFKSGASYYWGMGVDFSDSGKFKIARDNLLTVNTAVTIDSSNNVGIGTTDPGKKLHVAGSALFGGGVSRATDGVGITFTNNNTYSANSDTQDANRYFAITNDSTTANTYAPLSFRVNPSGGSSNAMVDIKLVANGSAHHLTTTIRNPATSAFVDALSIRQDGNVGIGTTDPTETLHVYQSSTNADVKIEAASAGDDSRLFIRRNDSSSRAYLQYSDATSNAVWYTGLLRNTTNIFAIGQGDDFGSNTRLCIDNGGSVGIGDTNPGAKLDVNGPIKLSGSGNGQEVQVVKGAAGSFTTVTIELQFPGAGSYNYEVGVSGTNGCGIQFGGGYTNATANFSHTGNQQVGNAWTVTSPSNDLVRLVSPAGVVGTHPTAYVKARFGFTDGFDEADISITFS